MSGNNTRRASAAEIDRMNERGDLFYDPNAPEGGEDLGPEFWAKAKLVEPKSVQPVLLKLDPEVVEYFKRQGKGHLTRMQNVLKAYVMAHTP